MVQYAAFLQLQGRNRMYIERQMSGTLRCVMGKNTYRFMV